MRSSKRVLHITGAAILLIALTVALGEIQIRLIARFFDIYSIEMVKYANELKMPDPEGIVSHLHRPSRSAKLMGVEVSLNSLGNRGPEPDKDRPKGRKRILVIGDSCSLGWGVAYEDVYTTKLERKLDQSRPFGKEVSIDIENAGMGNANIAAKLRILEMQFPKVAPDLVVLQYYIRDVEPSVTARNSPILKYSYLAPYLLERFLTFKVGFSTGQSLAEYYGKQYSDDSPTWQQTLSTIDRMRMMASNAHVPFVILLAPDLHDLHSDSPVRHLYMKMAKAFSSLGIPVVDPHPEFQKRFANAPRRAWVQGDDPHPNPVGHEILADSLYEYLIRARPLGDAL